MSFWMDDLSSSVYDWGQFIAVRCTQGQLVSATIVVLGFSVSN